MKRIGLVMAMKQEFQPIREVLGSCTFEENVGQFPVFCYNAHGKEVFAVISGIGEVRAAAATQILISNYNVECVLNFGLSGGLTEKLKALDVVLVDSVVNTGFDLTAMGNYKKGQHSGFASPYIQTDRALLQQAMRMTDFPPVVCASSDRFVDTRDDRIAVNKEFGAEICEMEAGGILLTCVLNNVPCLFVKTVSDSIDGGVAEFHTALDKAVRVYCNFFVNFIKLL